MPPSALNTNLHSSFNQDKDTELFGVGGADRMALSGVRTTRQRPGVTGTTHLGQDGVQEGHVVGLGLDGVGKEKVGFPRDELLQRDLLDAENDVTLAEILSPHHNTRK